MAVMGVALIERGGTAPPSPWSSLEGSAHIPLGAALIRVSGGLQISCFIHWLTSTHIHILHTPGLIIAGPLLAELPDLLITCKAIVMVFCTGMIVTLIITIRDQEVRVFVNFQAIPLVIQFVKHTFV